MVFNPLITNQNKINRARAGAKKTAMSDAFRKAEKEAEATVGTISTTPTKKLNERMPVGQPPREEDEFIGSVEAPLTMSNLEKRALLKKTPDTATLVTKDQITRPKYDDPVEAARKEMWDQENVAPMSPEDEAKMSKEELISFYKKQLQDPFQTYVKQIANRGVVLEDGSVSYNEDDARKVILDTIESEQASAPTYLGNTKAFDEWKSRDSFQKIFKAKLAKAQEVDTLMDAGTDLNDELQSVIPTALSNKELDPTLMDLKQLLIDKGLIDPTTLVPYAKLGNALSLAALEEIQDQINSKERDQLGYNSVQGEGAITATGFGVNPNDSTRLMGELYNPNYKVGNLSKSLLDKLVESPNQPRRDTSRQTGEPGSVDPITGKPRLNLGGAFSSTVDPKILQVFDHLLWDAMKENGFLNKTEGFTDPNTNEKQDIAYTISERGELFYRNARGLLNQITPDKRIDVSYTPPVDGAVLSTLDLLKYQNQRVSIKADYDKNELIANKAKNHIGKMAMSVNTDMLKVANFVVRSLLKTDRSDSFVTGVAHPDPEGTGWYSISPWAKMVGLSKSSWEKAYNNNFQQTNDIQAAEFHADGVMRTKAKKLFQDLKDLDQRKDKIYYNKIFNSTAVGRFFMRNTILNPLESKLVRNTVGSAKPILVNTEGSSKVLKNWMYIVARNLLNDTETTTNKIKSKGILTAEELVTQLEDTDKANGKLSTSKMPFYVLRKRAEQIFKVATNPTTKDVRNRSDIAIYNKWVKAGKRIRDILSGLPANAQAMMPVVDSSASPDGSVKAPQMPADALADIEAIMKDFYMWEDKDIGSVQQPDQWADIMQSLIDVANYDDARKSSGSKQFRARATTQHDGIQNGIALQGYQFGHVDILKHVGVIFERGNNIIPEGDIRAKFIETLGEQTIPSYFSSNEIKLNIWMHIVDNIFLAPDKEDITKDLSKQPLMETSYGRYAFFNQGAIDKFFTKEGHTEILMDAIRKTNMHNRYSLEEAKRDLNILLGQALNSTLNFTHQRVLSQMAKLWAITGKTPSFQNANGSTVFLGSRMMEDTGETVSVRMGSAEGADNVIIPIKKSRPIGDARSEPKFVLNEETGLYEKQTMSPYGQQVSNQLPVLSIQWLDAAIMGQAINLVNSGRASPLWMIGVHDAIISDATSVEEYHQAYNKTFDKINKTYSVYQAIKNSFNKNINDYKKLLKDDKDYLLSQESPGLRVLYDLINDIYLRNKEKDLESDWRKYKPLNDAIPESKLRDKEFVKLMEEWGFKPEGAKVKGSDIKKMIDLIIYQKYNLVMRMNQLHRMVLRGRAQIEEEKKNMGRNEFERIGANLN